jgi:hypothetical protein
VLSAGRKLTEGPPASMRTDPVVIEAYLGTGFDHTAPKGPALEESIG